MKEMYKVPEPDELEKRYKEKLRKKCEGNCKNVSCILLSRVDTKCTHNTLHYSSEKVKPVFST